MSPDTRESGDGKVLQQLGPSQRYIYREAKASFEKHAKNCGDRYTGPGGEEMCSHPEGGGSCRMDACPKILGGKGGR